MINPFNLLFTTLAFLALSLMSCEQDSSANTPMGEECFSFCGQGIVDCVNGYCECPSGSREIARGFCINQERGFNIEFVTYNQYPGIIDTMIVAFNEEPYNLTWETGDSPIKVLPTYSYNRNAGTENPGGSNAIFVYSRDPAQHVDTVILHTIYGGADKSLAAEGRHICKYEYRGGFTDRNTIVGNLIMYECFETGDGGTPRPEGFPEEGDRFPVTFTRVP